MITNPTMVYGIRYTSNHSRGKIFEGENFQGFCGFLVTTNVLALKIFLLNNNKNLAAPPIFYVELVWRSDGSGYALISMLHQSANVEHMHGLTNSFFSLKLH